ncbi:PREDICTED: protein FAM131A [Thamnophis sirtalis]|uniref:Protein FAM131A n=1 Tax=Thamnophis sirtalis TaxID=35019 RepID=A0A6I9Z2K3_9SAUR|nr:PREDICTED: protein FAM131A [Thamnophis sirtalis]
MGCIGSKTPIVAVDNTLHVEWNEAKTLPALSSLGHTRTSLVRRLVRQSSVDSQEFLEVNVEDTIEMLPKSRRALTIQEIAALARSSLHGISQVVKDHVTKPTAMAQGRVAHLIEWKGWCKPIDSPATLESTFNSYSDLSEGEQEARFAAGVAEQFAIAEAKLRAWSSVEGDDSNDESYDEDFPTSGETAQAADAVGQLPTNTLLKGFLHSSRLCHLSSRQGSCDPESDSSQSTVSPETLCSSLCSLDDSFLLKELGSPSELAAKLLGSVSGGEDMLISKLPTQTAGECAFRSLAQLECQDSMYSMSFTESCLSPTEEEGLPCKDYKVHGDSCQVRRKVSDVASSGVVSLDDNEDDEVEEEPEVEPEVEEEDAEEP